MSPVGYGKEDKTTTTVEFVSNLCHDGADYGPDYPAKTAELPTYVAEMHIAQGRAVLAPPAPVKPAEGDGKKDEGKGDGKPDPKTPPPAPKK